ncbi:MAG: NifB/NifX family molybdenum-iron cluster-binding protein [Hadesarchaea archaeon]|nr:NifB/NifX family molybdenum-iron cluster-binding protein [Hadesarchaea archaeon]
MKIGIPAMGDSGLNEKVSNHFGRAPVFLIVDSESGEFRSVTNVKKSNKNMQPPEQLAKEGIQAMICSDLGPRAIQMFEDLGIEVFVGAQGSVKESIEKWKSGELKEATDKDACEEHKREFP